MPRVLHETTLRVTVEHGSFYLLNNPPHAASGYPELPRDDTGETLIGGSDDGIVFSSLLMEERARTGSKVTLRWLDTTPEDTGGTQGSFHADDEIAFTTTTGTPIGEPIIPPYQGTVRYQVTRELIGNLAPAGFPCPIPEDERWMIDIWRWHACCFPPAHST